MTEVRYFRRSPAVVAALLIVATTGGSNWAAWRQSDAEAGRRAAAFREVVKSAKTLLRGQDHGSLAGQVMLNLALGQLDGLSQKLMAISNPDRNTAQMLSEMGDLSLELFDAIQDWEGDSSSEAISRLKGRAKDMAFRFFERALVSFQALSEKSDEAKRDLAKYYEKLNLIDLDLHEDVKVLEICQRNLKLRRAICDSAPQNTKAKRDLGAGYVMLGIAEARNLHLKEAIEAYQENLAIQKGLAAADPKSARSRHDMAVAYQKVADGFLFVQSVDEAIDACQKGLECLGHLSEFAKVVPRTDRGAIGDKERRQSNGAPSVPKSRTLELMLLSAELGAAIADAEGSNSATKADAARECSNAGALALITDAHPAAALSFQKAVDLTASIVKAEPDNSQFRHQLAYYYRMLGDAHSQMGDLPKALAATQKGLQTAQSLFKVEPRDVQNLDELSTLFVEIGTILFRQGDRGAALRAYRQSVEPAERALAAHPADKSIKRALANAYQSRGQSTEQIGEFVDARDCYEKALAANPDSVEARVQLATLLSTCPNDAIRDGNRAFQLAAQALKREKSPDADCFEAAAAACAEVGHFDTAIKAENRAIRQARDQKSKDRMEARLKLYQAHKPYRQPAQGTLSETDVPR